MSLRKDEYQLAECGRCTLKDRPYVPSFFPLGKNEQYHILFVGQAPGETEKTTRIPFTGKAGKMHYSLLRQNGLDQSRLAHTNTCNCFPPGDREPTSLEVECCHPRLKWEIQNFKPKLIIALGGPALKALTGKTGIQKCRGQFFPLLESFRFQCEVLALLHPSFVMRARQWIPVAARSYKLIIDYLTRTLEAPQKVDFLFDPSPEELKRLLDGSFGTVAVDTEATGLDVLQDRIIGHSFCWDPSFGVALYYSDPPQEDPRWPVAKEFLEDPNKLKCWQNGSYDTEIVRSHGVDPKGFAFDTRLAQQLLNSDLPSDLDFLRSQYTTIPPYKPSSTSVRKYPIHLWKKEEMLEYAALDAVTTKVVMEEQKGLLEEKQIQLMKELLIPLVRVIGDMERKGILVDTQVLAALYSQVLPHVESLEKEFQDTFQVNPRSPIQLKKAFDLPDTQEDTLKYHIKRGHPQAEWFQKLIEFRSYDSLASKYLKGIYKRLRNGRIHTHFKIEGTGTGRLASENPNMQNIPREMRIIYIADPGYKLLKADYSQIELWVLAILAGGGKMLKDLQDGKDIHYTSCQLCFPDVPLKYGSRKRDFTPRQGLIAKTVTFGTAYGRSPRSIAIEFGVSEYEASEWQSQILNHYPEIGAYRERCERAVRTTGRLETPFGRVRTVTTITQGYNTPIQSTASDITLQAMVEAHKAGLTQLLNVHDEIVFLVKEDYQEEFQKIKEVMERPVPQLGNHRFKAEYSIGDNWLETEELK